MQAEPLQQVTSPRRAPAAGRAARVRARGATVALACWGAVIVGHVLSPRASGYGTAEQLSFPGCSFLANSGYPCPGCGFTTSFSAMAHGRIGRALGAHPFGVAAFALVVVIGLAGAAELASGRSALHVLRPGLWWIWAGLIGLLAGWGVKLAAGCASGELPIH